MYSEPLSYYLNPIHYLFDRRALYPAGRRPRSSSSIPILSLYLFIYLFMYCRSVEAHPRASGESYSHKETQPHLRSVLRGTRVLWLWVGTCSSLRSLIKGLPSRCGRRKCSETVARRFFMVVSGKLILLVKTPTGAINCSGAGPRERMPRTARGDVATRTRHLLLCI